MIRSVFILAVAIVAYGQPAAPSFRWAQEIGNSDGQTVVGVRSDSSGNSYIAGTAASVTLQVKNAAQEHPGSSGLFRIDGPGSAWSNLAGSGASAVYALAVSHQDPNTIYAASQQGVLRSTNGGDSWSMLTPLPGAVNSIAVDPSNDKILYTSAAGVGLFKSNDGGATWIAIDSGILPSDDGKLYVLHLWVDPNHPSVVFAATNTGLARSSDGGATWIYQVQNQPSNLYAFDLSFDPLSPGVIYVASASGVFRSTDDGITWTILAPIPGEYMAMAILADPIHKNTLYAGSSPGLFQSADGGVTWISKRSDPVFSLAANASTGAIYAAIDGYHVVMSTDAFKTTTPVGPPAVSGITQLLTVGSRVFVGTSGETDVFVTKLDARGNIVYATYFGGSGMDRATGLAIDDSGAVYVTGTTNSLDFPVTPNAYAKVSPQGRYQYSPWASFVFKLHPDGSLAYSTFFSDEGSTPNAIAADASGNAYLAGTSRGGLPVTPGAYQSTFHGTYITSGIGVPIPPPTNAFLTKLSADGSTLLFSTYIGNQQESATALALAPDGNAFLAGGTILYRMSFDGVSLLNSTTLPGVLSALAVDKSGNLYIAGTGNQAFPSSPYPTTAGAFQTAPQNTLSLPGDRGMNSAQGDAFVTEFDAGFRKILASTLLSGEAPDGALALSIAENGDIIVGGYTDSLSFPLVDPVQQSFAAQTGFVARLTPDLTKLISSTIAGDTRQFSVSAVAAGPDGSISFTGNARDQIQAFFANLVPGTGQTPRIDNVVNAASFVALPLSPGETMAVRGDGFSASTSIFLGDKLIPSIVVDAQRVTAFIPADFAIAGTVSVKAVSGGVASNSVLVPIAPASPGIFSFDGTGTGQGYILNSDGTRNSPTNPALEGAPITIFATGVGQISFSGPYAVTATRVDVDIDGFYANGIAATFGPVTGLPGNVYQISVYIPRPSDYAASNPSLKNFVMPPLAAVNLEVNGVASQPGIAVSITH